MAHQSAFGFIWPLQANQIYVLLRKFVSLWSNKVASKLRSFSIAPSITVTYDQLSPGNFSYECYTWHL